MTHERGPAEADDPRLDRRKALGLAAAAGAAAWATPAILSVDAAGAATKQPPPPGSGNLVGEVTVCGHGLDPGQLVSLQLTAPGGGPVLFSGTTDAFGQYAILGVTPGTYDVLFVTNDPGFPVQTQPNVVVTAAPPDTILALDYTQNGC